MFDNNKPRNHLINIRRRNEDRFNFYNQCVKTNQKLMHECEWGYRMDEVQDRKRIQKNLKKYSKELEKDVERRREKLSNKLVAEERQFYQELESLKEDPSTRRKKLEERAKELKRFREIRHKEFCAKMMEKKFVEECDEVREVKRKIAGLKFAKDREAILVDIKAKKEREMEDEKWMINYMKQENLKKLEKEKIVNKLANEKKKKFVVTLNEQMIEYKGKKEKRKIEEQEIADRLKTKWKLDEQKDIAEKKKRMEEEINRRNIINDYNKMRNGIKHEESREELEFDKFIITKALEKEKQEERKERDKRANLKRKQKEYQDMLLQQMEKEKIDETEFDRLRKEENEKQYQKKYNRQKREEDARKKLLRECLIENERQKRIKDERKRQGEIDKLQSRKLMDQSVESYLDVEKTKLVSSYRQNRGHQDFILKQVVEKNVRDKGTTERELKLVKKNRKLLSDYEEKLYQELQKLNETKPEGYRHLNVVPKSYVNKV